MVSEKTQVGHGLLRMRFLFDSVGLISSHIFEDHKGQITIFRDQDVEVPRLFKEQRLGQRIMYYDELLEILDLKAQSPVGKPPYHNKYQVFGAVRIQEVTVSENCGGSFYSVLFLTYSIFFSPLLVQCFREQYAYRKYRLL